jgi:hypothetical protein
VQVKTRSEALTEGDIEGAIQRFARLRREHADGRRPGAAAFAVVANVQPGHKLVERLKGEDWPADTRLSWPGNELTDKALPPAWRDVAEGLASCAALAAALPFGSLVPETVVWKLAGLVMCAASGTPPHTNHAFRAEELPDVFEQLAVQLQDFPAPPLRYRSQAEEPHLTSDAHVRVITGFSGAGKTMWVAQAAQHSTPASAQAAAIDHISLTRVARNPILSLMPATRARWQERYLAQGIAGLKRDATRPGRKPPLTPEVIAGVVEKTLREKPQAATHWSTRTMPRPSASATPV